MGTSRRGAARSCAAFFTTYTVRGKAHFWPHCIDRPWDRGIRVVCDGIRRAPRWEDYGRRSSAGLSQNGPLRPAQHLEVSMKQRLAPRNSHHGSRNLSLTLRVMTLLSVAWVSACAGVQLEAQPMADPGMAPLELVASEPTTDPVDAALAELRDLRERLNIRTELRVRELGNADSLVSSSAPATNGRRVVSSGKNASKPASKRTPQAAASRRTQPPATAVAALPADRCAPDDPNRWDPLNGCLP